MSTRRFVHLLRTAQRAPASAFFGPLARARASTALVLLLPVLVAGCSKGSGAAAPSLFSNPGDVELICFNGAADGEKKEVPVVLPRVCCDDPRSLDAANTEPSVAICKGTDPRPHALVTQTVRGEVAAVDLRAKKVLDSEKRVPGYTFIDVGGQPSAIVAPPSRPCPAGSPQGEVCGAPTFTYVAGRENNEVRAISSCRFRLGRLCGPDLTAPDPELRRVALLGPPHDMLLDPNGRALWLTLPEQGLIARVELGSAEEDRPFAMSGEKPLPPTYFPLASGVSLTPPEPVEEKPYEITCGLGYKYQPFTLKLPNAPYVDSTGKPHPTRMELVDVGESEKLLFVVDEGQAVVHALALTDDDALEQRALLPVGQKLRDFAVTPAVPALAPDLGALVGTVTKVDSGAGDEADGGTEQEADGGASEETQVQPPSFAYGADAPADVVAGTKRYLYAIDDRNMVMVFDLTISGGVPALQPLLAPSPARDDLRSFGSFADRLSLGVENLQARTLTVIDTRQHLLADGELDDRYCGQSPDPANTGVATVAELDQLVADTDESIAKAVAKHHRSVRYEAGRSTGAQRLRGVFLLVATTSNRSAGEVMVVDVHDLDLQCRALDNCSAESETQLNGKSGTVGLAVRRHAVRLSGIKATSVSVSGSDDLEKFPEAPSAGGDDEMPDAPGVPPDDGRTILTECPEGYYDLKASASTAVCGVADPWRARQGTWVATYRGETEGNSDFGYSLVNGTEGTDLTLLAPKDHDFCHRGVESELFAVSIASAPKKSAKAICTRASTDRWRLLVRQAYADRLLVDVERKGNGDRVIDPAELRACYDDLISVQPRLADTWRVSVSAQYSHRMTSAVDGACIVDETRDALLEGKTDPSRPYRDPYITFQLSEAEEGASVAEKETINPSITLTRNYAPVFQSTINAARGDALPTRMRFFPQSGYTFVVDAASQGLTSLQTLPFGTAASFY